MKRAFKTVLASLCLATPGFLGNLQAQYVVDAQMTSQPHGDGTYDYTITLNNRATSSVSIGTFWFAWIPTYYGYDLAPSYATPTQMPTGWYGYPSYGSGYGYYADGYSVEYYNSSGSYLAPGQSFTFGFNSPDSPTTLAQQSPYYQIPTLTSYVYETSPGGDAGYQFAVTEVVPEPSTAALLGSALLGLVFVARPRRLAR